MSNSSSFILSFLSLILAGIDTAVLKHHTVRVIGHSFVSAGRGSDWNVKKTNVDDGIDEIA